MAISTTDFQTMKHIIDMAMNFARFKALVQRARDDISTSSEELANLVRHIKNLQDYYVAFQGFNIPVQAIRDLLGETKLQELIALRNALQSLKVVLKTHAPYGTGFDENDNGLYPPVDQGAADELTPALDAVLALYA